MTPLGTIFRSGSCKPPKIDQRSLFTSIQVSIAVLEGDLQVYEPWKKKRNKPKECHATLYVNETSPFLVWYKLDKSQRGSTSESPSSPAYRPRCVISVSRASLAKTAGGSFEMTEFASKLTFRFIAKTIREAETWVGKLAEESLREANLDMRSICSSRSSFSSTSGFPSPDPCDASGRIFSFMSPEKRAEIKHERLSSRTLDVGSFSLVEDVAECSTNGLSCDDYDANSEKDEVFVKTDCSSAQAALIKPFSPLQPNSTDLIPRHQQTHIRAQPHLGVHVVMDKHRPELRCVLTDMPGTSKPKQPLQTPMPLSEYFVNVPDS